MPKQAQLSHTKWVPHFFSCLPWLSATKKNKQDQPFTSGNIVDEKTSAVWLVESNITTGENLEALPTWC